MRNKGYDISSLQLVRHFTGLQSLLLTIQQAGQELGLLMVLVSVIVITISRLYKMTIRLREIVQPRLLKTET